MEAHNIWRVSADATQDIHRGEPYLEKDSHLMTGEGGLWQTPLAFFDHYESPLEGIGGLGNVRLTEASGNDHGVVGPETGKDEPVINLESCFDPSTGQEAQSNGDGLDDSTCDADDQDSLSSGIGWPRGIARRVCHDCHFATLPFQIMKGETELWSQN